MSATKDRTIGSSRAWTRGKLVPASRFTEHEYVSMYGWSDARLTLTFEQRQGHALPSYLIHASNCRCKTARKD